MVLRQGDITFLTDLPKTGEKTGNIMEGMIDGAKVPGGKLFHSDAACGWVWAAGSVDRRYGWPSCGFASYQGA